MNQPQQTAPGSSALDEASQEFYVDRFGERYWHVQQYPGQPSRSERRTASRQARLRGDGKAKQ